MRALSLFLAVLLSVQFLKIIWQGSQVV